MSDPPTFPSIFINVLNGQIALRMVSVLLFKVEKFVISVKAVFLF